MKHFLCILSLSESQSNISNAVILGANFVLELSEIVFIGSCLIPWIGLHCVELILIIAWNPFCAGC